MTNGERRLAERLESKLDDDDLLWYEVPVGASAGWKESRSPRDSTRPC
jgi:hypothetical protein